LTHYLTVEDVCRINEAEVGPNLLADFGLVESAVLRPQQSVMGQDAYSDLHSKAAALFHSLINNHAFVDGNKRTAVLAVIVFYNLNGRQLRADQDHLIEFTLTAVNQHLPILRIAQRFEAWVTPMPPPMPPPPDEGPESRPMSGGP
jgi:death-on-curing protein